MKLGIMQPYFIPYIGYWQLLNAVDKYVIYDDVNYINRGWINRNRILIDGTPSYLNISLLKASQNKKINEIYVNPDTKLREKCLKTIELAYRKAPYFSSVFPLMEEMIKCEEGCLSNYLENSLRLICSYLNINTIMLFSSSLEKDNTLKGQDKVLNICSVLGATEYYNAIGGRQLYSYTAFQEKGIVLKFLKTNPITYCQFRNPFQENLSILDVMMFNSAYEIKEMLNEYTLLTE